MNKSNEQKLIEQFIESAVRQTETIFKPTADEIRRFKMYFEDMIMFEIISCKSKFISFESMGNKLTDNLKVALIASGISEDGTIPVNYEYASNSFMSNFNIQVYAKKRVKELEKIFIVEPYLDRCLKINKNLSSNTVKTLRPVELVRLGISRKERESGYIEEQMCPTDKDPLLMSWHSYEQYLKENDLSDTLTHDICKKLYDSYEVYSHFPFATRVALESMTDIEYYVTKGAYKFVGKEYFLFALRNIKAAKITNKDLIEPFEKRFMKEMKPYIEESGINLEPEKPEKAEKPRRLQKISQIFGKNKNPFNQ